MVFSKNKFIRDNGLPFQGHRQQVRDLILRSEYITIKTLKKMQELFRIHNPCDCYRALIRAMGEPVPNADEFAIIVSRRAIENYGILGEGGRVHKVLYMYIMAKMILMENKKDEEARAIERSALKESSFYRKLDKDTASVLIKFV